MWLAFFTCAPVSEPQLAQSYFIRSIVSPTTKFVFFFFLHISHTLGMEYGTVNVSTENVKYCGRNCFLIAKDGTFPQSLLEHCECQQEEHWMKKKKRHKKKQERAWRGSDGVRGGGWKTERKDASSLDMYSWETGSEERGKKRGKKKFSLSWAWKQPVWAWPYPCWPHAEQQFLRSVNTSTQHVIADKPSVKTNTVQFTGKPDNVTERQDQRRKVSDLEGFHVVALITFLLLYVSKTRINKKCWNMWMWSLMERTPLFLATEATWDNISYYIFSEVIEASAQRKVPPFSRPVSVSVRAFLCSLHSKCGKLH